MTTAQLAECGTDERYDIESLLVAHEPCVIAGPPKTLKTSIAVELAISLPTGAPVFGRFDVVEPVNVGLMSGESGRRTLAETARRVAFAKGIDARTLDRLIWCIDPVHLDDDAHLNGLGEFVRSHQLGVLFVDPAYLALGTVDVKDMFAVGRVLQAVSAVCTDEKCSLVIIHHSKRNVGCRPLELADLAWSAWDQWARQWLLVSRRKPFDPTSNGEHRLWLSVGGSAGHSNVWALDVSEGRIDDTGGRHWEVIVRDSQDVAPAKDAKPKRTPAAQSKVVEALSEHRDGLTVAKIRSICSMSGPRRQKRSSNW